MRELIWRTVRAFVAVLAVMMLLTLALEYRWGARAPLGAAQLLADHYATNPLDSHWRVREVEAEPGRVVVHLTLPSGAAASFQRIPAGAQFQAFGTVCPRLDHPVWDRVRAGEDIVIHSASRTGESIMRRLSCRRWNGAGGRSQAGKPGSWAGKSGRGAALGAVDSGSIMSRLHSGRALGRGGTA